MEHRSSSPDQGSFDYTGFNGFGYMRPARDNILNKTFYTYVPLSRMPRDFEQHRRSMSPQQIVIDITEEEQADATSPNLPAFPLKRETPSLATDCPMADLPTVDGDEHQREAFGNTHMVANRPLERVHDAHVPSLKQMQIQYMLNPTTPMPHGQYSRQATSNNPLFYSHPIDFLRAVVLRIANHLKHYPQRRLRLDLRKTPWPHHRDPRCLPRGLKPLHLPEHSLCA